MVNQPQQQHYGNHIRIHPLFHYFSAPLTLLLVLGSLAYAIVQLVTGENVVPALLLFLLAVAVACVNVLVRLYAAKVQDRVIRAETTMRHYMLTGKALDRRLTIRQIIALRFAGDEELPALSAQAAESGMGSDEIKKAIRSWQADHDRV